MRGAGYGIANGTGPMIHAVTDPLRYPSCTISVFRSGMPESGIRWSHFWDRNPVPKVDRNPVPKCGSESGSKSATKRHTFGEIRCHVFGTGIRSEKRDRETNVVHFILDGSFTGRFPHRRMPNLEDYWGLRAMIATERSGFSLREGMPQKSIDTQRHLFTFI